MMSSLVAGALLFGSAFVSADRGTPPVPPVPPAAAPAPLPPKPPKAPKPPKPPKAAKGVTVTIDGIDEMIDEHIQSALDMVGSNPDVPPAIRDKVTKKLDKLRSKLKAKLGGPITPDQAAEIGDEIGHDMDEFGHEMEAWGEKFGEDMQKKFGAFNKLNAYAHADDDDDDDDDDDAVSWSNDDDDDDDIDDAIRDMGGLGLQSKQRDQIQRLRADSEAKVTAAKRELDRASDQLRTQLANPNTSDADITRAVDAVAQQEAAIRKARILAWVNARRILDDAQRKKVEGAAHHRTR
jgi:hypothetical protein